ncbi:MAG: hypothetical protein ACYS9X_01290 [Planctomycetota bacterium]|jgi:hypothetical protein
MPNRDELEAMLHECVAEFVQAFLAGKALQKHEATGEIPAADRYILAALTEEMATSGPILDLCAHVWGARTLLPGQTRAVSLLAPKSAALFYDRVWYAGQITPPPEEVMFTEASREELRAQLAVRTAENISVSRGIDAVAAAEARRPGGALWPMGVLLNRLPGANESVESKVARRIAGLKGTVPFYSLGYVRDADFRLGGRSVIVATLADLKLVDERQLTWDQVLEFRKDGQAKRDFRRMMRWLDMEMEEKSVAYVESEISERLEAYEKAIAKHGLKWKLGKCARTVLPSAGGTPMSQVVDSPVVGALGAGFLAGAGVIAYMTEEKLDIQDAGRKAPPEVAFVHEVKELGEGKDK